ncbi:mitochondrial carrier domain-containing protein [Plectosphaerella plurivora]|uniref:Mitochondrial carrier domain-containing protein n=1 Tax=Plectosphaerella plurivora TaxID=936078 RepID=A0A9P9AF25_9PEZI|nr:mitochondrial carrier domain-containing protein [Plectosphaerella plurivora]
MSSHRDGVNPLRPYYRPPVIGETLEPPPNAPNSFSRNAPGDRYTSKARDMFSDLDYRDYVSEASPSTVQTVKDLIDELMWKYTSVLMAQPFEVAKTVLQIRSYEELAPVGLTPLSTPTIDRRRSGFSDIPGLHDDDESDSEGDEPAYFTSNMPHTPTPAKRARRGLPDTSSGTESPRTVARLTPSASHLTLRLPDSIMEVIGQLWQKEGAWGVWKGSNATFLYTVISSLLENWTRSALSALCNVPDLGVKDDIDRLIDIASPYPWASLGVAAAAAVAAGLLLAPLDMVRTRLLVTPASKGSRRTLTTLRSLPSYFCPSALVLPTIFHSLVHPLLTLSTPLVLRTRFMIDSQVSPTTFSVAKFLTSTAALFVKLPIETVLRRGQVSVMSSPTYLKALSPKEQRLETVVPVGRYNGVTGTMLHIMHDEGSRAIVKAPPPPTGKNAKGKGKPKIAETVYRKGQGAEGLWRGWRVSWWGLVGLWAAGVIGSSAEGEF